MKRPAIFFDRDNTLIATDGYLGNPLDVKLVPGAGDAVARARALGFATVVVSNQSGVARGMFKEDDVKAVNAKVDELLHESNASAVIDRHEYCPYHPEAVVEKYKHESERRKPKPGMILEAARSLALDLSRSWSVGDSPRDVEAGKAAGCKTVLVRDPQLKASPASVEALKSQPDAIVTNLAEAMDFIAKKTEPSSDPFTMPVAKPEPAVQAPISTARLESTLDQILSELRRQQEPTVDFSVSKLLAGIVQVIALALVFLAYLNRNSPSLYATLMVAIYLQTLTVALLMMGKSQ